MDEQREIPASRDNISRISTHGLGVEVTPMSANGVIRLLETPTQSAKLILNHNLHSVYLFHRLKWFRSLYASATAILIDGWPILRLTVGSPTIENRIGSTDWLAVLQDKWRSGAESKVQRIFVLGGDAESNSRARNQLAAASTEVVVSGADGYFDIERESAAIVAQLSEFEPDLVLVGMGMPLQERFLANNFEELPAAYYATVGGAIDYLADKVPLAPRLLGRLGFEWLWRFLHAPRRLFTRYFVEPICLLVLVALSPWRREP